MNPGWGAPSEGLYRDLRSLSALVKIAWLEAQAFPDRAEEILSEAARNVGRIAGLTTIQLRESSERAQRRENAAERATFAAEARIRRGLADLMADAFGGVAIDPNGFYVYCLWDSTDGAGEGRRPIYVGKSTNILARLGAHMSDTTKRYRVKRITVIKCKGQTHMDQTESRLIQEYQPELNTVGIHAVAPIMVSRP